MAQPSMPETHHYAVLHYGEVSLKGRNRPAFLRRLRHNIQQALSDLGECSIHTQAGRMLLAVPATVPWECLNERLSRVFGLANFSPCLTAPHHLEAIKETVSQALEGRTFGSFRIQARRAFKELPWGSQELNRLLGTHVLGEHSTRVDLTNPELTVHVEVIPRRVLVYLEKRPGAGGLPVGTSGRVVSLLSGGLDSPVASYRMLKRGCEIDFVHFHSYPFVDRSSQDKAHHLASLLTRYQYASRLFLVPFGTVQQQIVSATPAAYRVVLYRRYMLRLATALAHQVGALALVTGESLGQVASQTLSNLQVIEAVSTLPVLRPLIGMDKAEIMHEAKNIETFATSILPDQDCCTLFVPRHPATHTSLTAIEQAELALDTPALVQMALDGVQTVNLCFPLDHHKAVVG